MPKEDDLKDIIEHLATFGWSEEKAKHFARDKVAYLTIQVPIVGSVETLRMLCTEGIPAKPITVVLMVPQSRLEAFKQVAEMAANKAGGFFMTAGEKAGVAGYDSVKERLN